MPATTEFVVTIHRVTGDPLRFKIQRTAERLRSAGSMIEHSLKASYFGVELDGKLIIVPMSQIVSIEIDPAPQTMISHVLKDAEPLAPAGSGKP